MQICCALHSFFEENESYDPWTCYDVPDSHFLQFDSSWIM